MHAIENSVMNVTFSTFYNCFPVVKKDLALFILEKIFFQPTCSTDLFFNLFSKGKSMNLKKVSDVEALKLLTVLDQ